MRRRDLLVGASCVAAVGIGEALRPRRELSLMGTAKLEQIVPPAFGGWRLEESGGIIVPKTPGSLADTLYNDTLTRTYVRADGMRVMLLIAHGTSQSDLLQLHRPESCYPAVGFAITHRGFRDVPLDRGVSVPGVELTAKAGDRTEDVLYWTRLGEYLPRTAGEQRADRLKTAMRGYVADGVLVRASAVRSGEDTAFAELSGFAASLLAAVAEARRAGLIGTQRAAALA